jgi:hypothetical protein
LAGKGRGEGASSDPIVFSLQSVMTHGSTHHQWWWQHINTRATTVPPFSRAFRCYSCTFKRLQTWFLYFLDMLNASEGRSITLIHFLEKLLKYYEIWDKCLLLCIFFRLMNTLVWCVLLILKWLDYLRWIMGLFFWDCDCFVDN